MKHVNKIYFIILFLITFGVCQSLMAQMPDKISFQAIIRNTNGTLVTNSNVGLRFSILPDTTGSPAVYSERNQGTTNPYGLLIAKIGGGTPLSGSFTSINWDQNAYFLKMEADPAGGTNYTLSSYVQLLTVPYAFAARTVTGLSDSITNIVSAMPVFSGNYDNLSNKPNFTDSISNYFTTNSISYNNLTNLPNFQDSISMYSSAGDYNLLTNKPNFADSISSYFTTNSISYNNLTNLPNFQDSISMYSSSVDYNLLTNVPNITDSISNYFTTNSISYNNLTNLPNFQDSISMYSSSVDYNLLTNVPNITDSISNYFTTNSISYNSLTNLPNIQDSISLYSFSGDYDLLTNKPNISDSISNYLSTNSISYNNLANLPNFQDSIALYSSAGDYNLLTNKPNFNDSIFNYITNVGVSYNDLDNRPNMKDTIADYILNPGIYYNTLKGLPNIKDSVLTYSSAATDYNLLSNKPNIKDSISMYSTSSVVKTNGSVTFSFGATPQTFTNPVNNRVYAVDLSGTTVNLNNAPKLLNGTQQTNFLNPTNYATQNKTLTYQGGTADMVAGQTGSRVLENGIKGQMHSFRVKISWDKGNNVDLTIGIILYNPDSEFTYRVAYTPQVNSTTNGATIYLGGITADTQSIGKGYVLLVQAIYPNGTVNNIKVYEVKMISDFTPSESNV